MVKALGILLAFSLKHFNEVLLFNMEETYTDLQVVVYFYPMKKFMYSFYPIKVLPQPKKLPII